MTIYELIPQRPPIVMVDELTHADGDEATCVLTVRPDNFFIGADNRMEEVGLIEHIAQSASAFAGHKAIAEIFLLLLKEKYGYVLHFSINMFVQEHSWMLPPVI